MGKKKKGQDEADLETRINDEKDVYQEMVRT